jgi:hypothetical protein
MERFLRRFGSAPLWIAAAAIVLTVIFGDLPGEGRYVAVLQNSCHAPAFAALTLITLTLLRRSRAGSAPVEAAIAVGAMLAVGVATEGAQSLLGRDAELEDVISDVVGSLGAAGLGLYAQWRGRLDAGARIGRIAALALCVAAVGYWLDPLAECARAYGDRYAQFPILAQFRSRRDLYFVESSGTDTRIVAIGHEPGGSKPATALQAVLDSGPWPGFTLSELTPDWRGYHVLNVDVSNPGSIELPLRLRVNDRAHRGESDDRFNMDLLLASKARTTVRIPLENIAGSPRTRRMDMSEVTQLILFRDGGARGQVVRLHRVWLE